MNIRSLVFYCACLVSSVVVADDVIQLYDKKPAGSESWTHTEGESTKNLFRTRLVFNVVKPTLTKIAPEKPNGTSLIICPGGGFHCLSIDNEGMDVAQALAKKGVTCFVLKYRMVPCKTADPAMELMAKGPAAVKDIKPVIPLATEDGLQAVRYVRTHAKHLGVDPNRVGLIGFSAGGTLAVSVSNKCEADSRPDFLASIYCQYDWANQDEPSTKRPPLYIAAATNDQLGLAEHSLRLYRTWMESKTPVELHIYEKGGHGFGMRKQGLPTDDWINSFVAWMSLHKWID